MKNKLNSAIAATIILSGAWFWGCKKEMVQSAARPAVATAPVLNAAPGATVGVHVDTLNILSIYKCNSTNRFGWCKSYSYESEKVYVTVKDSSGTPVSGVVVYGDWSGCYKLSASAITGSDGVAVISGQKCKTGCKVVFNVTNIAGSGYHYDQSADRMNKDDLNCPR